MRNGLCCYPLTILDHHSLLPALLSRPPGRAHRKRQAPFSAPVPRARSARRHPQRQRRALRVDRNPRPLGITHQRITPGNPQQNERMHKTLKDKVTRPPAANLNLQQRVFNRFRHTYNGSDPTKHSMTRRLPPAGFRQAALTLSASGRPATRATSRSGASATPAASACTPDRSSCPKLSIARRLASSKSPTASGTSSTTRRSSDASTKTLKPSPGPLPSGEICKPCPRTFR